MTASSEAGPSAELPVADKIDPTVTAGSDAAAQSDYRGAGQFERCSGQDQLTANIVNKAVTDASGLPADDESVSKHSEAANATAAAAEDNAQADENADGTLIQKKKKTKKKNKKSAVQRGLNAPSGFEEYYVDPPVTPAEFKLEDQLYHKSKPFSDRIQIAIQRYSSKRKFDEKRRGVWLKYLKFGGIETGPKQFNNVDMKDLPADTSAEDIITLKATEFVFEDILHDEHAVAEAGEEPRYAVDFDGVVRGFFSLHMTSQLELTDTNLVKTYCGVIRNWLNYLLHHNVCNEYKDDIHRARYSVDLAEKQLSDMLDLRNLLPGTFGAACKAMYTPPRGSDGKLFPWINSSGLDGFEREDAEKIFMAAIASLGTDELCDLYDDQCRGKGTSVVESADIGLDITGIFPPTEEVRTTYAQPVNHGLTPVGYITARTWYCPWAPPEDLTEEEEAELPAKRAAETRDYMFYMDEETIKKMSVGMKMFVEIKKLSFGLWYIEHVKLLYPSFVLFICNELMDGWREHEWIPPKGRVDAPDASAIKEAEDDEKSEQADSTQEVNNTTGSEQAEASAAADGDNAWEQEDTSREEHGGV